MAARPLRNLLISAITAEARLALVFHRPKVIAVTGNLGKTSAKDAIFAAVSGHFRARKSAKSFNSEIGVPLSILGCDNPWSNPLRWIWILAKGFLTIFDPRFPELLVLEVGADRPGDISSVAHWLKPSVAVFTGIPDVPVHVENFPSRDALVREKRALFESLRSGGAIVLNADAQSEEALSGISATRVTYGFAPGADFAASNYHVAYKDDMPQGIGMDVIYKGESEQIMLQGALGKPRVYAALAGLAVAQVLGIRFSEAARALSQWKPAAGRLRLVRGVRGLVILDDSYNASPAAAKAALDTLSDVEGKRRIAILGDMLELGSYAEAAHREIGELAAKRCDLLLTVGVYAKSIASAARAAGMSTENVLEYGPHDSERAGKELAERLVPGDVVLVKGSQGVRMERAVRALMREPKEAPELLVRQEAQWMRR